MKTVPVLALAAALATGFAAAQENVKEESTGKMFPAKVSFTYEGTSYTLPATGTAVRKKFVFKVYGMVHYMQDASPMKTDEALKTAMAPGKAKQITMDFARDVTVAQIRDAYKDGFAKNATAEETSAIQPAVDQFLGFFAADVRENDQFTLRWLPGGKVVAVLQGQEKPAITQETFARVLWRIWFGEDSIVDPEDLVKLIAK